MISNRTGDEKNIVFKGIIAMVIVLRLPNAVYIYIYIYMSSGKSHFIQGIHLTKAKSAAHNLRI